MFGAARLSASSNALTDFTYIGRGTPGMFSEGNPEVSYYNLPSATRPGDIIVLNTFAVANADYAPTVTHPSGFIEIGSAFTEGPITAPNQNFTLKASYRQIPSDDNDLPRQYGMEVYDFSNTFMAVFRPNGAVNTIAAGGALFKIETGTSGISQTLSASALSGPYIALGFMSLSNNSYSISPRTTSVTMTEFNNGSNSCWMKYKFYQSGVTGENITFTQENESSVDSQSIFYLKFTS